MIIMTRVILHTDSGTPYVPSNFIPDNGLASLAGSLSYNGHEVDVVDRNTLNNFGLLIPENYRGPLGKIFDHVYPVFSDPNATWKNKAKTLPYIAELVGIDKLLAMHRQNLAYKQATEFSERIIKEGVDIVGFKYFLGSLEPTVAVCREIKKQKPGTVIVAGGPLVDLAKESPSAIFEANPYIDVAVFGEGEKTIVDIADYVYAGRELKGIPNTVYRDGSGFGLGEKTLISDLDSIPLPIYLNNHDGQFNIKVFEMSRGCNGKCPFCTHVDKSGGVRRTKSKDRIMDEIENLVNDGTTFFIEGSSNPNIKRAYDVAGEISRRQYDIKYVMFGSALEFNEDLIEDMARSGLSSIFFGFESGDPEMLARILGKGSIDDYQNFIEKLERSVNASRMAGIYPVGSLVYPLPFETEETAKSTFETAVRIFKDGGSVPVNFAGLYTSSEWGRNPEKYGFRIKDKDYPHDFIIRNLGYKIKTLFPPPLFWKDLGYEYSYFGEYRPFKEFARETGKFRRELSRAGITVGASHDTIFIGQLYDDSMPPSDFINVIQRVLFTGDVEKMGDIIAKVNHKTSGT